MYKVGRVKVQFIGIAVSFFVQVKIQDVNFILQYET